MGRERERERRKSSTFDEVVLSVLLRILGSLPKAKF